jgi:hypothetical protein
MKNFYFSLVAMIFAFALFSCNTSDLVPNTGPDKGTQSNPKGDNITTIANPAIAYTSKVTSGKGKNSNTYETIGVMDADATHQTNVYTASTTTEHIWKPTWSPDGISLSWIKQEPRYSGPSEIVAADITVNSNGVPVAGNYRTIASVSPQSPDYFWIFAQAWCSKTETAKIAFIVTFGSGISGTTYLYTVSTSGGEWNMLSSIYTTESVYYSNLCWSPDDSKIAVLLKNMGEGDKILIFDSQTGDLVDEILPPSGVASIFYLDWSRSGMNTLAFVAGSAEYIYYVTPPTTGTTPTTNNVTGVFPSWSPDNSSLLFYTGAWGHIKAGLKKVTPFTSNVTTISSTFSGFYLNWKR